MAAKKKITVRTARAQVARLKAHAKKIGNKRMSKVAELLSELMDAAEVEMANPPKK